MNRQFDLAHRLVGVTRKAGLIIARTSTRCGRTFTCYMCPFARLALMSVLVAFVLSSCDSRVDSMLSRLLQTEDEPTDVDEASEHTIEELEADVAEYRDAVNERFSAARNLASAHRMLGMRYLESDMYGPALDQFQNAADIQGGNATLFYYAGVSAANHAKSALEEDEREQRYETAERAYLRALELRDRYPSAAYGLAVLYAYELDRPEEAREYIDKVLDWRTQDVRALAVSGYVYSQLGRVDEAIREYDAVIEHADDEDLREQARNMRQQLMEGS